MPSLLTKAQACLYLAVSLPTLNRRIREGSITVYRVGRLVRISQESLIAALEAGIVTNHHEKDSK